MFVQLFSDWHYRDGARQRNASLGLGGTVMDAPRPDVPGLVARLLATDVDAPDTGIALWVWEDEGACRAYEAARPADLTQRLDAEIDHSAMTERNLEMLSFGCRVSGVGLDGSADPAGSS